MTSANQPHYEDSPPITVSLHRPCRPRHPPIFSHRMMPCARSLSPLATAVSALAAIACYMYLNRGVYNPADAILPLAEGAALACTQAGYTGVATLRRCMKKRDK